MKRFYAISQSLAAVRHRPRGGQRHSASRLPGGLLVFVLGLLFFSAGFPSGAEATRFSGAYLHKVCGTDDRGRELIEGGHTACQAYIAGVIDYHNVLQSLKIAPRVDICIPKGTSSEALHKVVLNFLDNNIEHDSFIAAPAVTMALYQKFPCR